MAKITLSIDEGIAALQKAKEIFAKTEGDEPSIILVLPNHGLAANVIDFEANQEDRSVRVVVRGYMTDRLN